MRFCSAASVSNSDGNVSRSVLSMELVVCIDFD